MSNKETATSIIKLVGGSQNISSLIHCATRLRFELHDSSKADREALKALPKVLGVMDAQGQTMVIIGPTVNEMHAEIMQQLESGAGAEGAAAASSASPATNAKGSKKSWFDKLLATISAIFTPYIPILATSGIIKGLIDILAQSGVLPATSNTYLILAGAGNALIYFFPILLAFTAAQKFGANPYIGAAIGAALMEPNITGITTTGNVIDFLGIRFTAMNFSSTVIPIILAIWAYSHLDKLLKRFLPKMLQFVFVPLLSMLIMVPLTLMVFGPVGGLLANLVADGYEFFLNSNVILFNAVFGALFIYVIMLGIHWVVLPLQLSYLAEHGMEYSLGSGGMGNYALLGVCLAVMVISKSKEERTIASSSAFVNFLSGVTEPGLYGVVMKNKKYFISLTLGGLVGGIIFGMTKSYITNFAFTGLFGLPAFLSSPTATTYFIAVGVTLAVSFFATILLSKQNIQFKKQKS
ncbi:PTS beta-glucoside transporter subunit IIABC [Paenibacillus yonginensis]|uniref:PTS beta-glucoside transporter subunit IIABC n=1 Tax=Paenibacillus yonginensis TaxID=1462996 RepID=A0A1B1N2V8_9BACL|nr:PTS transporter subunit EIIC [Paenibacillus yonginensis]ANS75763.1 PTS beta-glucoside transporter subunit IIABC [Paenibacillus yonginensis]